MDTLTGIAPQRTIFRFESLVSSNDVTGPDATEAAEALASYIVEHTGDPSQSFAGAIQALARSGTPSLTEAALLLRALSVKGLMELPSLECDKRFIAELCERNLPEVAQFSGSPEKRQTYDKLVCLQNVHGRLLSQLAPLEAAITDIDGIIGSRTQVLSVLNNGVLKAYCAPFEIQQVRTRADTFYRKIGRLAKETESFWDDLTDCETYVAEQKEYCRSHYTFVTAAFAKFVDACATAIDRIVQATRGRARTLISARTLPNGALQKRYPFHDKGREITLSIPLRSSGPGVAGNVTVAVETGTPSVALEIDSLSLGNVVAGDFSAVFRARVLEPVAALELMVTVSWEEGGNIEPKHHVFLIEASAQNSDVDWGKLEYEHPYSTDVAKGDAFVGRSDQVKALANRMLRHPMEPFFVTGQKRIGKTSLALAAAESAKALSPGSNIRAHYLLWGKIAHDDPRESIRELGERFAEFISGTLPREANPPQMNFNGSLAPLTRLADFAAEVRPELKYVLIIDEFDEIHPELYQQGNLAETFFANLRALTTCENLCLVLVGGENMPFIMDRQGQKLNKLIPFRLDYFSRDREWDDFKKLVRKPTDDALYWHDDAISEIFNLTNGNPYFAKIVCSNVFQIAVRERDADITAQEVKDAITANMMLFDVNSFAHLWMDGIHKPAAEREPDIVRRSRVLVAIARAVRRHVPITLASVIAGRDGITLSDAEISPVLNDFVKRGILKEHNRQYDFVLPVFEAWLTEVGISRLLTDTVGEELAASVIAAEDKAYVTSEEISALVKRWPTYQGKQIGAEDVRAWLNQVAGLQDQRLLFKILQHVRFYEEIEIRERLKTLHGFVRPLLPEFVQRKRSERRMDVLITYIDGEGKSGQYYASRYAEENNIGVKCIMPPGSFSERIADHIEKHGKPAILLIVDDIIATGQSVATNLEKFSKQNGALIEGLQVPILTLALAATADGDSRVRSYIDEYGPANCDLRYCETLDDSNFAFDTASAIWADGAERDRAKALVTDLGSNIYRDNPLGFGRQGILVVFPTNCPNNSLPVLHSKSRPESSKFWQPLFPRLTN